MDLSLVPTKLGKIGLLSVAAYFKDQSATCYGLVLGLTEGEQRQVAGTQRY